MRDPDPPTSAEQDAWVALAEQVRTQLARAVPLMGAMTPNEAETLVRAVDAATRLHLRALTFDDALARERNRVAAPEWGI